MSDDRDEVRRLEREMEESGLKHPPVYHPPEAPAPTGERTSSSDAGAKLRERWRGDLNAIPLGKVVEFMQSFAEDHAASVLQEVRKRVEAMPVVGDAEDANWLNGYKQGARSVLALLDRMEGK